MLSGPGPTADQKSPVTGDRHVLGAGGCDAPRPPASRGALPVASALGAVTFLVDSVPVGKPVTVDGRGRASYTTDRLERVLHWIRARYDGGETSEHHPSSSPNLLHTVRDELGAPAPKPRGMHV
jgi:hypothetical protein